MTGLKQSFHLLSALNVDVMSGAHVAILDFEAEHVDIVEQQERRNPILYDGGAHTVLFC